MMTLFMTLLVRDEEDIIEENITYHLSQGVDHFIVTDNKSVDNTRDILRKFEKDGLITYIYEDENDYSQSKWVTRMAVLAAEKGADWVINADADEFWYPLNAADLKKCLRRLILYNVAIAQRHDFVCLDKSHGPFYENMIYRKTNSLNPVGKPLPPKVAHRAHTKIHVAQGNHEVSGFRWQRAVPNKLEILHYPLRSREQYENKIRNGGKAYMNNKVLPSKVGNTWRRQYEELMNNGSLKYVTENAFTMDKVDLLLKSNDLIIDKRLVDHMHAMGD
jgi:hypothetical protein